MLVVIGTLEAGTAYLDLGADNALELLLVGLQGDQAEARPASELCLRDRRILNPLNSLNFVFFKPVLNLLVAELLGD